MLLKIDPEENWVIVPIVKSPLPRQSHVLSFVRLAADVNWRFEKFELVQVLSFDAAYSAELFTQTMKTCRRS